MVGNVKAPLPRAVPMPSTGFINPDALGVRIDNPDADETARRAKGQLEPVSSHKLFYSTLGSGQYVQTTVTKIGEEARVDGEHVNGERNSKAFLINRQQLVPSYASTIFGGPGAGEAQPQAAAPFSRPQAQTPGQERLDVGGLLPSDQTSSLSGPSAPYPGPRGAAPSSTAVGASALAPRQDAAVRNVDVRPPLPRAVIVPNGQFRSESLGIRADIPPPAEMERRAQGQYEPVGTSKLFHSTHGIDHFIKATVTRENQKVKLEATNAQGQKSNNVYNIYRQQLPEEQAFLIFGGPGTGEAQPQAAASFSRPQAQTQGQERLDVGGLLPSDQTSSLSGLSAPYPGSGGAAPSSTAAGASALAPRQGASNQAGRRGAEDTMARLYGRTGPSAGSGPSRHGGPAVVSYGEPAGTKEYQVPVSMVEDALASTRFENPIQPFQRNANSGSGACPTSAGLPGPSSSQSFDPSSILLAGALMQHGGGPVPQEEAGFPMSSGFANLPDPFASTLPGWPTAQGWPEPGGPNQYDPLQGHFAVPLQDPAFQSPPAPAIANAPRDRDAPFPPNATEHFMPLAFTDLLDLSASIPHAWPTAQGWPEPGRPDRYDPLQAPASQLSHVSATAGEQPNLSVSPAGQHSIDQNPGNQPWGSDAYPPREGSPLPSHSLHTSSNQQPGQERQLSPWGTQGTPGHAASRSEASGALATSSFPTAGKAADGIPPEHLSEVKSLIRLQIASTMKRDSKPYSINSMSDFRESIQDYNEGIRNGNIEMPSRVNVDEASKIYFREATAAGPHRKVYLALHPTMVIMEQYKKASRQLDKDLTFSDFEEFIQSKLP